MLQDFISTPALRDVVTSKDHKAWYLPVALAGELATPAASESYKRAVEIVKTSTTGRSLTAHLSGPAATVGDMTAVGERDVHVIEIATALMVLTILLVVYRNPITMALPLVTIAISLVVAQQIIAWLAQLGLSISPQAIVLVSGMMLGAGTDYAVFLISRYHEYLRMGEESDTAVVSALGSIGKVIAASAGTVAITFLGMSFAKLGVFSTIGPALAITIIVGFLASITLLPAMVAIAGRRGLVKPRGELRNRFWRRSGIRIVLHPVRHLVASLIVLAILASCVSVVRFNYDDRKSLPADVDSNVGYEVMAQHFPVNSSIQQFILVQSPRDLRSPKALADLEQMGRRVSQVPGIDYFDTFAPVAKLPSIRIVLAIANRQNMELHQVDIKGAYLNGDLTGEEVIFMRPPPGYPPEDLGRRVLHLKCTLYGLKQSGCRWYQKLTQIFVDTMKFHHCNVNQAIFFKRDGKDLTIVAIHIDDCTIATSSIALIDEFKVKLKKSVEVTDLGELHWLLGIEIKRDRTYRVIHLSQRSYIKAILCRYSLEDV